MGLDVPELDDRTYEEFVEDARRRIPSYDETWTDYNAHDPGITFLELFAWLAESYAYQLDQVTDAHRRKYLRLLGVRPQPPQPASVRLALGGPDGTIPADLNGETIDAGKELEVDDGLGTTKRFRIDRKVTLTRSIIERVITGHADGWTDNSAANAATGAYFLAFGEDAAAGSSLCLGFDADADPFAAAETLNLAVDFHDEGLPAPAAHGAEDAAFRPSVELRWELYTDDADRPWRRLVVRRDTTNSLYSGGDLRLRKRPGAGAKLAVRCPGLGADRTARDEPATERYWIRCVVERGGYEVPPQLNAVRLNTVRASHRGVVTDETLVRPDGGDRTTARQNQVFAFEREPVLRANVRVGGEDWSEVEDFDASGPDDRHYVLDHSSGELSFGDGVAGRVPDAGQRVLASRYVHGGGTAGNVPRLSRWRFVEGEYNVPINQQTAATGGRDAESLDEAMARLRRDLGTPYRTVTTDDYRRIATSTPGLRFGRAHAVVEPGDPVEGCESYDQVRLVVVPYSTRDRPEPSEGFLDAVSCHVENHRLLTDRVTVEPPTYVGVGVEAEVSLRPGYAEDERRAAVVERLEKFLHPLAGYEGDGWPFGRALYSSELYEVIEDVEGVDCALDVSTSTRSRDAGVVEATDPDGTIRIDGSALLYSLDHHVTIQTERERCGGRF